MNPLELLTNRNRQFAANHFDAGLTLIPKLRTVIIGCVDPRVDPAHVLGLEPGDAAVIRNVGGRVTPGTLHMMAMLQNVGRNGPGGRFDLIVLQHTDCGITHLEDKPDLLTTYFGTDQEALGAKALSDPRAAVALDVAALRANPLLPRDWRVSGLVYDVHTGRLEVVTSSENLPA